VQELDDGHPRRWLILAVVALGMFMALLDSTIVNIAIPTIVSELKTTITHVSWVLNAYNIGLAALFLSFGRLADRFGQKLVFISGLLLFSLFSLACGLAPSIGWLIAFRVGQSVGAAAMVPVSLTILMGAFPRRQHGMATAMWGAIGAIAAAVGPTLGGVLVQYLSWHWIFFVNVPLGVIAVAGAIILVPEHRRDARGVGVDLPGIALSGLGFFALTLGLIQGNSWGWASGRVIGLLVGAVVVIVAFGLWEWLSRSPMLDLSLFRIRSFSAASASMFFVGIAYGAALLLLVIFLVDVLGYTELRAAVCVTPMPAVGLVMAPFVGRMLDRIGPRFLAALGGLFFVASLLLLSQLNATSTYWDVTWRFLSMGAGFSFTMPSLTAAGMGSLPDRSGGVGAGVINTSRQFGMVMGVAILVAVFAHTMAGSVNHAVVEAKAYVTAQGQIPAAAKQEIITSIEKTAAENQAQGPQAGATANPLAGLPPAAPGSPEAAQQKQLSEKLGAIFKTNIGHAFRWPYWAAAFAALLSIPFSLMTGRRLGQHRGDQERTAGEGEVR